MKKIKISLIALLLVSGFVSNAQAFEQGRSYVSVSYGYQLVNFGKLFNAYDSYGDYKYKQLGPIGFQYEYALSDKIGLGVSAGYTATNVTWSQTDAANPDNNYFYKYKGSKITGNARLNVHMGEHDKLDPYFGFGLGFKSSTWKLDTNDDFFNGVTFKGVPVSMEAKFGVRYFFVPALGAFAELGIGHGFANVGLVGKF